MTAKAPAGSVAMVIAVVAFSCSAGSVGAGDEGHADLDPMRFWFSIDAFMRYDRLNAWPKDPVLFVGSSSIRSWPTALYFPTLPVINRGFGGAHISDVNHWFKETTGKYDPQIVVFYAGDNDIEAGKDRNDVLEDWLEFTERVWEGSPEAEVIYISIKPSPSRREYWPEMEATNALILNNTEADSRLHFVDVWTPMTAGGGPREKQFSDGLHLSLAGYNLWTEHVRKTLDRVAMAIMTREQLLG